MTETDGTSHAPLEAGFREYFCVGCGTFLFETNVPLDTPGVIRFACRNRHCRRYNPVAVGKPPRPRASREEWLARRQPRAVSLDRLTLPSP